MGGAKTPEEKWKCSLATGILFFIIANPAVYKLVDQILTPLLGKFIGRIAGPSGCPTMAGVLVHAIVYMLLVRAAMEYS